MPVSRAIRAIGVSEGIPRYPGVSVSIRGGIIGAKDWVGAATDKGARPVKVPQPLTSTKINALRPGATRQVLCDGGARGLYLVTAP